jgi:hypothetical protein
MPNIALICTQVNGAPHTLSGFLSTVYCQVRDIILFRRVMDKDSTLDDWALRNIEQSQSFRPRCIGLSLDKCLR